MYSFDFKPFGKRYHTYNLPNKLQQQHSGQQLPWNDTVHKKEDKSDHEEDLRERINRQESSVLYAIVTTRAEAVGTVLMP